MSRVLKRRRQEQPEKKTEFYIRGKHLTEKDIDRFDQAPKRARQEQPMADSSSIPSEVGQSS